MTSAVVVLVVCVDGSVFSTKVQPDRRLSVQRPRRLMTVVFMVNSVMDWAADSPNARTVIETARNRHGV